MDSKGTPSVAVTIIGLIKRMGELDPDFRFMALSDLMDILSNAKVDILAHDFNTASRTVEAVVRALNDPQGDVQNQAVKCIGPVAAKMPIAQIPTLLEKLATMKLSQDQDPSLPSLAIRNAVINIRIPGLKAATHEIPKDYQNLISGFNRCLVERLIKPEFRNQVSARYGQQIDLLSDPNAIPEQMDVLIEVIKCLGNYIDPGYISGLMQTLMCILQDQSSNSGARKRAVNAISLMANLLPQQQLDGLIATVKDTLTRKPSPFITKLFLSLASQMTRTCPQKLGSHIRMLTPLVVDILDQKKLDAHVEKVQDGDEDIEYDELADSALATFEAFVSSCPEDMNIYTEEAIDIGLRFSSFDPNAVPVDKDDEDDVMDDDDELEDDEEYEDYVDDDSDSSWRLRKAAIKVLHSLITIRESEDLVNASVLYRRIAPALVKRFSDSDENVQLEAIAALALVVRKTGEYLYPAGQIESAEIETGAALVSRKRRRQSSNLGSFVAPALPAPPASKKVKVELSKIAPSIIKASTKVLNGKLVPANQAIMNLMDDLVKVMRGGLQESFEPIIAGTLKCLDLSHNKMNMSTKAASGTTSSTQTSLKAAGLTLIRDLCKYEPAVLEKHLKAISKTLVSTIAESLYKITGDAIWTAEEIIKAYVAEDSSVAGDVNIVQLYSDVHDFARQKGKKTDVEVRQRAVHALGTIITQSIDLGLKSPLSQEQITVGFQDIFYRLTIDSTQFQAIQALEIIASRGPSIVVSLGSDFLKTAVSSLVEVVGATQKRQNVSVAIRALRRFINPDSGHLLLPTGILPDVVFKLQPAITSEDGNLMTAGLWVLHSIAEIDSNLVAADNVTQAVASILINRSADIAIEPLMAFVTVLVRGGNGGGLMSKLLVQTDKIRDIDTCGRVIGSLLVAGHGSVGVTVDAFIQELQSTQDIVRKCMALTVLGEASKLLQGQSPITPDVFINQFGTALDKVSLTAAISLGRAASGNVKGYLPVLINSSGRTTFQEYLCIYALKELFTVGSPDLEPALQQIWEYLNVAKQEPEHKIVVAECLAKLLVADPATLIPRFQQLLSDPEKNVRSLAIHCLRYTLPNTTPSFEAALKTSLVSMLLMGLQDVDLENRRLGMTNLTTAVQYKPEIVLPRLADLMNIILEETKVKQELVREIMMGPFKHQVDSGLDTRKGAYETLYAQFDPTIARLDIKTVYERVVAGLYDENDIRSLSNLMILKLANVAPEETINQLNEIAKACRKILSVELKDNAVKQEVEKQGDAARGALEITIALAERVEPAAGQAEEWNQYWQWVQTTLRKHLEAVRAGLPLVLKSQEGPTAKKW